jgi:hypothetical protein
MLLPAAVIPYMESSVRSTSHQNRVYHTAMDDVAMKTPPSGFALKVGAASLNKERLLLTLVDQHYSNQPRNLQLSMAVFAVLLCPILRQSMHPDRRNW